MSKQNILITVITALNLLVYSCSKVGVTEEVNLNNRDASDNVAPILTIARPADNQVYQSGDSIVVEGKVVNEKVMYKGKVQIKNEATGIVVAEGFYETHHLNTLNFRLAYKAVVITSTDFSTIMDFQDHGYNSATATIKVKLNP